MDTQLLLHPMKRPKIRATYKKIPVAKIYYMDIDESVVSHIESCFDKSFNEIYLNMDVFLESISYSSYRETCDKTDLEYILMKDLRNFYNIYKEFEYLIITFNNPK